MSNQFLINPEKFISAGDTTLEYCVKLHDDQIDAFTGNWSLGSNGTFAGVGIGVPAYQSSKQTFIVHNGEVYIRAAAIESGTIKTK